MAPSIGAKGSAPEFSRVAPGLAHSPLEGVRQCAPYRRRFKARQSDLGPTSITPAPPGQFRGHGPRAGLRSRWCRGYTGQIA
jgi:hypothetical protein